MAAYCTPESLELYLGRALTDAESDSAPGACLAATDFIDRYTGKSWQGTTVTGELQTVPASSAVWSGETGWYGRLVRLDWKPVVSVTSVTARGLVVGETPRVLVAGTGYELIDPLNGRLLVNESTGTVLTVTYVTGSTVPATISQAANIIAAAYAVAGSAAAGTDRGIQKLKAGSVEITYDPVESVIAIPSTALELLSLHRPAVMFA